jgi:hypothetical protein
MNRAELEFEQWWKDVGDTATITGTVKQVASLAWHTSCLNTLDRISGRLPSPAGGKQA